MAGPVDLRRRQVKHDDKKAARIQRKIKKTDSGDSWRLSNQTKSSSIQYEEEAVEKNAAPTAKTEPGCSFF